MSLILQKYSQNDENEWDDFVLGCASNGTLLQSRKFLNYHKEGKFEDCSLIFRDGGEIVAVCPACVKKDKNDKVFSSHSGTTYGGIILNPGNFNVERMLELLNLLDDYLQKNSFSKIVLKQTNPLMCTANMDLVDFCLTFSGYKEFKELDLYVNLSEIKGENVLDRFSKMKKRQAQKCLTKGMQLVKLSSYEDLERFLTILSANLSKYDLKPYHSVEDLIDIQARFPDNVAYWGCEWNGQIVAVSMVFTFDESKCAHTHYLAADPEYAKENPMTFIYYQMIEHYYRAGFKYLSWGITTEHLGIEINYNLTSNKEQFGSHHNVVSIYEKGL